MVPGRLLEFVHQGKVGKVLEPEVQQEPFGGLVQNLLSVPACGRNEFTSQERFDHGFSFDLTSFQDFFPMNWLLVGDDGSPEAKLNRATPTDHRNIRARCALHSAAAGGSIDRRCHI